jgi:putative transposase
VKTVSDVLEVSRSNLTEQVAQEPKPRRTTYVKPDDEWLLPKVRTLVAERASYGYRRLTALLNRQLTAEGKSRVNHKRIYRLMRRDQLLLQRHTGKSTRTHDGTIITLKSDLRWCSDSFEIRCWNGERVQVAFSLDCCDREVMSYVATTAAITGEMVRDLMAEAVEQRFGAGARGAPHPVEWLSDNGPPYTAHETRAFGASLGLLVCNTPSYSPESNGMAESFVKRFKADYVYLAQLDTAAVVLAQLPRWLEDYNEVHPHRGLRMQSPREYRRSQLNPLACPV